MAVLDPEGRNVGCCSLNVLIACSLSHDNLSKPHRFIESSNLPFGNLTCLLNLLKHYFHPFCAKKSVFIFFENCKTA